MSAEYTAPQIYILCDGGFGNRLCSLITGLGICFSLGRIPTVIWPLNDNCFADFYRLIGPTTCIGSVIRSVRVKNPTLEISHTPYSIWLARTKLDINILSKNEICRQVKERHGEVLLCSNSVHAEVDASLVLKTAWPTHFFSSNVRLKVRDFLLSNNLSRQGYSGLHLRRTDLQLEGEIEQFVDIILRNRDLIFFVSSDDAEMEKYFLNRFDNVLVYPKVAYAQKKIAHEDWTSLKVDQVFSNVTRSELSVTEAMVDLGLLAASDLKFMPANPRSTFLLTAKMLSEAYSESLF